MRRAAKIGAWVLGVVVLVPVVLVLAVFGVLNTGWGQREAGTLVGRATGGSVVLEGLAGRFPDRLRVGRVAVRDGDGAWLTAEGLVLDWHPLALLGRAVRVERLEAARFALPRLPVSDPAQAVPAGPSKPFTLPVRVVLDDLKVARAEFGAPVLGTAAAVGIAGSADLRALDLGSWAGNTGQAALALKALGEEGSYTLSAALDAGAVDATLRVAEPEGGLVSRLAKLPALGAIKLDLAAKGPAGALDTVLSLDAGPLVARAKGTVDVPGARAVVDATARAPAMEPAPGVSWRGIDLDAHVAGPWTAPDANGHLVVDGVAVAGASLRRLSATLAGNAGQASVEATLDGLRIPGPSPALLEGAPVKLDARARLDDPARPVRFSVSHPLLDAKGVANTGGVQTADVTLELPDLGPIGAIAGLELAGRTGLRLRTAQDADGSTRIEADGTLGLRRGPAPAPALIGTDAKLGLSARLAGSVIELGRLTLDGAAVNVAASGASRPEGLAAVVKVALPRLDLVVPQLTGSAALDATVGGAANDLKVDATLKGDVGAPGIAKAPLVVRAALTGLPSAPAGRVTAEGSLVGAPVQLALVAERGADGALHAVIQRADWRSFHAEGDLRLPAGASLPTGTISLRMARLEELQPLAGPVPGPWGGSAAAEVRLDAGAVVAKVEARNAVFGANRVGNAVLNARVTDPLGQAVVAATLDARGIDAGGTTGSARVVVAGPKTALSVRLDADVAHGDTAAKVGAAAVLDTAASRVRLDALTAAVRSAALPPETIRLLAPATVRYAPQVSVDRLRLGVRQAVLEVAGRVAPTLDATVTLRTPADIAAALSPEYAADGAITLDARLTGNPAAPAGTVKLAATGVRLRTGPGRAAPAANLNATVDLQGARARVDARLVAGSANLAVNGTAPLGAAGALDLRANGALDLGLLDPVLTAAGRRVKGKVALNASVGGTLAAPRLAGTATLAGGEVQDFAQGFRLYDLAATVQLAGDVLRIDSLTGKAGQGTIGASGTVGVLQAGIPVELRLQMRNARPLASDLVTADVDGDLRLSGAVGSGLRAGGSVLIRRAVLNIPKTLPASVVTLDVRRPGDKVRVEAAAAAPVGLDLVIDAPGQVFLRGRGVDAEMQGRLRIGGTSVRPQVSGGLEMRRGLISVAGTTLNFTRGRVGFDGTGVSGRIDPTLDFVAESATANVTARLGITGYVSKPVIKFSSSPDLPQDEVLAYLLFKRSAKELGPFQIAEIAAAVAELTGVGGSGGLNPLESVRKGLGLDRLSLGSGTGVGTSGSSSAANAPTVEAGRYVADGIYVGARQGTTGAQTGATVQIDITKGLKAETDVGTGRGANSVGLTYEFEY